MTSVAATSTATPSKGLNIALWIAQGLLGFAFLMAGIMKSTQPIADLAAKMVWPGAVPEGLVRFIGVTEFLGALGLILPSALRIMPKLTVAAAAGLALTMVLAFIFHVTRGEIAQAGPVNGFLFALAVFIAWGRSTKAQISPRS